MDEIAEVTDVNWPLCVALGPSLDWFFGYQSIDDQQKWIRRREKGPALKYGSFYKSCLFPSFIFVSIMIFIPQRLMSVSFTTAVSDLEISGCARQEAYDRLESWLRVHASKPWDMPQTRVSLGPNGSYFAMSPAGGATWISIPKYLQALMEPNRPGHAPTVVTLGVKATWFVLWPDGSSSCSLDSEYQRLEELLRRHGKSGVNVS